MLVWAENTLESIQVLKIRIRTNYELNPSLFIPSTPTLLHPLSTHKFFQPRKIFLLCLRVEFTASVLRQPFLHFQLTEYLLSTLSILNLIGHTVYCQMTYVQAKQKMGVGMITKNNYHTY